MAVLQRSERLGPQLGKTQMIGSKSPETESMWQRFRAASGIDTDDYHALTFGDPTYFGDLAQPRNEADCDYGDELTRLCLAGRKRATCHLAMDFDYSGIARRNVGDYWVVLDAALKPACIVRIVEVVEKPFNEIDADFALREGEGDGTFDYWDRVHREYFQSQCRQWGREWRDDYSVVCETFELVSSGNH